MVAADGNREGTLSKAAARQIDGQGKIADSFVDSTIISNKGE
jgi:hypothetical protein